MALRRLGREQVVKTQRRYLFIEGANDITNGDLRAGFGRLLEKKLRGRMPTIDLCGGKNQTVEKFLSRQGSQILCDLDGKESTRNSDLKKYGLLERENSVFYMIEEMEAWFISQSSILDTFYKTDVSKKLAKKPASEFPHPDEELQKITKDSRRGEYHKIRHGALLLAALDADQLMKDFPDFRRLIESF